jgi:TatD DNase family protein
MTPSRTEVENMLIDSHAHLSMPQFDRDRDEVIRRSVEAGVELIFTVGTDPKDCRKTLEIARGSDQVFAIIGIHPHNAKEVTEETYSDLRAMSQNEKVRAIGEIGLDFYRNLSPRDIQVTRFREQIHLARELNLPIVVHARDAHGEVLAVLKEEEAGEIGGVFHCFSGNYDMAKACLDLGFFISIPGTITFKNSGDLREALRKIPFDRILVETDCPFLAPVPVRGKRNEPAYVKFTASKLAEVRESTFDEVARITTENTKRAFRLNGGRV